MRNVLEKINPYGKIFEVSVDDRQGPVHATTQIFHTIDNNEEVIISYCDYGTYWNYEEFLKDVRSNNGDGSIACYKGFHPHMLGADNYAFLRETDVGSMYMDKIQEKMPFTDNKMNEYASNGTYYFKTGAIMKKYFKILMERNMRVKNEFYVSMVYNLLREDNLNVRIFEIENMLQWGTPYDLEEYNFWSNYFSVKNNILNIDNNLNTTLILPMAGHGSRFKNENYELPKPLLPVDTKTMIECAVDCLPKTVCKKFICLKEHIDEYNIKNILENKYDNCSVTALNHVTQGQACTCELGFSETDHDNSILISACDNGVLYDTEKYNTLLNDETIDIIVWTYKNQSASKNNPNMYAWLETDDQNNIINVSCKKFNPDKHNIKQSHVIIGTMFYRKGINFINGLKQNYENKIMTNGEYYVDDVINANIKAGLKVKAFQVSHYICWGTPNDYKTYLYWQEFFNKCNWHSYTTTTPV